MPRVPQRADTPQVTLNALPAPRLTATKNADDFGAGIGRAISTGAEMGQKFYLERREKEDNLDITDRINKFQIATNRMKSRYQKMQGVDALEQRAALDQEVKDLYSEVSQGANERVSEKFQQYFLQSEPRIQAALETHYNGENRKVRDGKLNAAIEGGRETVIADRNDPEALDLNLAVLRTHLENAAEDRGMSQIEHGEFVETQMSQAHGSVLSAMLDGHEYQSAELHLKRFKNVIEPQDAEKFEALIADRLLEQTAQEIADGVSAVEGLTITQQEKMVKDRVGSDPQLRKQALQAWKANVSVRDAAERERVTDLMKVAQTELENNTWDWKAVRDSIGSEQWESLPSEKRQSLINRSQKMQAHLSAGGSRATIRTNMAVYRQITETMRRADPEEMEKLDLADYDQYLSISDAKKMQETYLDWKFNGAEGDKYKTFLSEKEWVKQAMHGTELDEEQSLAFHVAYEDMRKRWSDDNNGKTPQGEDVKKMVLGLIAPGSIVNRDPGLFDSLSKSPRSDVFGYESDETFIPDEISDDARRLAKRTLADHGINDVDDQRFRTFGQWFDPNVKMIPTHHRKKIVERYREANRADPTETMVRTLYVKALLNKAKYPDLKSRTVTVD